MIRIYQKIIQRYEKERIFKFKKKLSWVLYVNHYEKRIFFQFSSNDANLWLQLWMKILNESFNIFKLNWKRCTFKLMTRNI